MTAPALRLTASAVVLALASCASPRGGAPDPCTRLPLLARYEAAGLVQRWPGAARLHLVADLHHADCGAPDCYGTDLVVALDLRAEGDVCRISRARVWSTDFVRCGPGGPPPGELRVEAFRTPGGTDLAAPALPRLELRQKARALVLLPDTFYWFDRTEPGAPLHLRLRTDADATSCCFGASSSALLR